MTTPRRRLSVEEHGLTRLPRPITSSRVETAKKKKSVANFKTTGEKGCSVSGCSFLAKARGVCNRHRGGSIGSAGGQGGVHTSGSRLRRIVLRPVEKPDAEEKIFTTAGAACDFLKSGKPQFYAAMQSGKAYKGWFVLDEGGKDGRRQTQKKRAICATKGCSSNAHLRDHCRKHFKITVQSRSGLARPLILRSAKNPRVEKRFGSTSAATTFLKYGRNCSTSCVYRAINSGDALKGWYIFDEGQQRVRQSPALPKPVTRKGIAAQRSGTVILRSAKNLVIVKRFDDMANAGTFLKCGRKGSTMISNSMNSGDALRGWYIFDASQQQTQRMVYLTSAESPEAEKIFSSTFDAARFFDCTFQTINAAILSRKAFRGWHISATRKATNQTASKKALPPATKKPAKRRPITPKTPTPSKKERQQHTGPRMAVLHSARTTTAKDSNHAQDFSTKKQSGKREKPTTESTGSAPTKRQRKRQEIVLTDAMDSNHVIICESIAVAMKHMATTSYKSFYKCLREGVVFQDKWYVTYTTDGNEGSKRLKKVVADASGKAKAGSNLARSSAPKSKSKSKSRAFKSKKGVRSLLPLNWKSAVDKKSGQTYYYHKVTKAVTWDRPPAETPSTAPAPARETNTAVHAKRNQTTTLTLTPTPTTTPMPTVSIASIAASIAGPVFLRLSVGTAVEVSLADGSTQKAFILRRDKVLKTYDVQFDDKTVTAPSTNLARPCIRVIAVDLAKAVLLIKKEPVNDSFPDEGPAPS